MATGPFEGDLNVFMRDDGIGRVQLLHMILQDEQQEKCHLESNDVMMTLTPSTYESGSYLMLSDKLIVLERLTGILDVLGVIFAPFVTM